MLSLLELRRSQRRYGNCVGASRDVVSCCAGQWQVRYSLSTSSWSANADLLVS